MLLQCKLCAPYVLWYFPEGHSFSDIGLIHNNAKVGSRIACALSRHKEKRGGNFRGDIKTQKSKEQRMDPKTVSDIVSFYGKTNNNKSVLFSVLLLLLLTTTKKII